MIIVLLAISVSKELNHYDEILRPLPTIHLAGGYDPPGREADTRRNQPAMADDRDERRPSDCKEHFQPAQGRNPGYVRSHYRVRQEGRVSVLHR